MFECSPTGPERFVSLISTTERSARRAHCTTKSFTRSSAAAIGSRWHEAHSELFPDRQSPSPYFYPLGEQNFCKNRNLPINKSQGLELVWCYCACPADYSNAAANLIDICAF